MQQAKFIAKTELYIFLSSSLELLNDLPGGKNQLAEELLHYSVQYLFPSYKTADEVCAELISILQLFECPLPGNLRSQVAEAMAKKAVGMTRRR